MDIKKGLEIFKTHLVDYPNEIPSPEEGFSFNLYNNTRGTNFPVRYGKDARFRFRLNILR